MSHEVSRNTEIHSLLKPHGLLPLGLMQVSDKDQVPDIAESRPARQLLLVGNGGSSLWPVFSHSAEFLDGLANPLDRWSRRVGEKIATDLDARAIFPFDGPPYPPFLSWAGKTGRVSPSPVSMFLHAKFGLWHAYRFAIAFSGQQGSLAAEPSFKSACTDCKDQACLKTCPVDAFTDNAYRVDQCMDYLVSSNKATCRSLGCEARRACPVGKEFTYLPAHAKFHMDAFVDSNNAIVVCQ
ncbi:MAG: hypothetical protein GY732_16475 [Gammaproteobacteria bacterium]|nr:hypothetical protein [Gammaproteobacteria bacterium]